MQDILGLGEESRMNLPATSENNWTWRLLPEQITPALIKELAETTVIYGRGGNTWCGAAATKANLTTKLQKIPTIRKRYEVRSTIYDLNLKSKLP